MNILIVEDEALLALELQSELEEAGHQVVGQAMSSGDAINLAERTHPEFAFVDIQLLDGPTGVDVGRSLAEHGIPFVFMTGNLKRIPEDFAGAIGAIEKPYSQNGLQNALKYIEIIVKGGATKEESDDPIPPPSLVLPSIRLGA